MNLKLKSSLCIAIFLFFTLASIQAQERYVSQTDIDNFIANFDAMSTDDSLDKLKDDNIFSADPRNLLTAVELVVILEDFNDQLANRLKEYGMNSEYPIESHYTIALATSVALLDSLWLGFFMPSKIKKSIHPDDLRLIKDNLDSLSDAMDISM